MRRIRLVLAVGVLMAMLLGMIATPAMADDFTRCRDLRGGFVRCHGDLFREVDNDFDGFGFSSFFFPFDFDNNFVFFDDGFHRHHDGFFFGISQEIG